MDKRQMDEWIADEMRRHPWADDRIARKIVEDNLRYDIHYYDKALNEDQRMVEEGADERGDEMRDPYPDDEDEDEEEEEPRRHRGPGKPKGGVLIVFGGGKKKDDGDPYPED